MPASDIATLLEMHRATHRAILDAFGALDFGSAEVVAQTPILDWRDQAWRFDDGYTLEFMPGAVDWDHADVRLLFDRSTGVWRIGDFVLMAINNELHEGGMEFVVLDMRKRVRGGEGAAHE
jgi:hypothetical protein